MQRANDRRVVWIVAAALFLLVLAAPGPAVARQVSTPSAGEDAMYYDPAGRFAVPIPTNWVAEELDGYMRVVTDDKKISIAIIVVPGSSATASIGAAMRLLDPAFDATPIPELMATPASGSDEVAFFTYDDGSSSGRLLQAFGRRVGDSVVVLVLDGDREAIKLRQVQVDKIQQGILIDVSAFGTPVATPVN